jgi:hypothetical protein
LHANNRARNAVDSDSSERIGKTTLLRTSRHIDVPNANTDTPNRGHTLVAVNGRYVIQIAAVDVAPSILDEYAKGALEHLAQPTGLAAELAATPLVNSAVSTGPREAGLQKVHLISEHVSISEIEVLVPIGSERDCEQLHTRTLRGEIPLAVVAAATRRHTIGPAVLATTGRRHDMITREITHWMLNTTVQADLPVSGK